MDSKNECRACLSIKCNAMSLMEDKTAIIFTELTAIQVNVDDKICSVCCEKLLAFKDFKEQCLESNDVLVQREVKIEEPLVESEVVLVEPEEQADEDEEEIKLEIEITDEVGDSNEKKMTCEQCSAELSTLAAYRKHVKMKHPDTELPQAKVEILCPFDGCNRVFFKQDRLNAHLRVHEGKKPEVCKICQKELSTTRNLMRHMVTHTDAKPFQCQYCEKTFATMVSKRNHENMHTKAKLYICDTCGQIFHHRSGLAIHQNRHIDEKRFMCTQCPRAYKSKVELNDHLTRHKGIRDHVCDICNKTFLVRKDLKLHERMVHKAQPKFECTECQKKYRKKCQLETHMRSHTGERPFTCTFCSKGFRVKQTLIKHTYSHTGEKPFQCPQCPKAYTEIFIMKRHMRQQHEKQSETVAEETTPTK